MWVLGIWDSLEEQTVFNLWVISLTSPRFLLVSLLSLLFSTVCNMQVFFLPPPPDRVSQCSLGGPGTRSGLKSRVPPRSVYRVLGFNGVYQPLHLANLLCLCSCSGQDLQQSDLISPDIQLSRNQVETGFCGFIYTYLSF